MDRGWRLPPLGGGAAGKRCRCRTAFRGRPLIAGRAWKPHPTKLGGKFSSASPAYVLDFDPQGTGWPQKISEVDNAPSFDFTTPP